MKAKVPTDVNELLRLSRKYGYRIKDFREGTEIYVNDTMQCNYNYKIG